MGYAEDIRRFQRQVQKDAQELHRDLEVDIFDSITDGSPLTGAPGQPKKTGRLYRSWSIRTAREWVTEIFTDSPYAGKIERGRWKRRESKGGGSRSVALTRANFRNLVIAALAKVRGRGR